MFPICTKICIFLFQTTVILQKTVVLNVLANVDTPMPATGRVCPSSNVIGMKRPIRIQPPETEAITPRLKFLA